jgi:hypothetical protein
MAKRKRRLGPADVLLVGRLYMHRRGPVRGKPTLGIEVWCPYCKRHHVHGWDTIPLRADSVSHRSAHCDGEEPRLSDYWIGPDPSAIDHNREVARQFERAAAAWNLRQAMTSPTATRPTPTGVA